MWMDQDGIHLIRILNPIFFSVRIWNMSTFFILIQNINIWSKLESINLKYYCIYEILIAYIESECFPIHIFFSLRISINIKKIYYNDIQKWFHIILRSFYKFSPYYYCVDIINDTWNLSYKKYEYFSIISLYKKRI